MYNGIMRRRSKVLLLTIVLLVIVVSCGQSREPNLPTSPTTTVTPVIRFPTSTETIELTHTPNPTSTAEIRPTSTRVSFKTVLVREDCLSAGLPEMACTGVFMNGQWQVFSIEFGGVEMVLVPAGCFVMGDENGFSEEQPIHEICFDQPFWIDRTEVTVSQFADFLNGQPEPVESYDRWLKVWGTTSDLIHIQFVHDGLAWSPVEGEEDRPLEHAVWIGADSYCSWRGVRLPTEAEWEYAARGPDNLLFPWGNEIVKENLVIYRGKNPEVGSNPQGKSWVGALDMSGSVFEWTSSVFLPYPYQPSDGRELSLEEDDSSPRVFRGSPWYHNPDQLFDHITMTARFSSPPDFANWYFGFRCAKSID